MAEIKKSDLIEKGVFNPAIKDAKKFKKVIDDLIDSFKESLKVQNEFMKSSGKPISSKDIKEQSQALQKVDDTVKTLNKTKEISIAIDKQILAQEKKLKIANSDKIDQKEELAILTKKQNAANKDEAILNSKLTGTIEKLTASTRKLKRQRNELNLETKDGIESLKKFNEQIDENDAAIKENVSSLEQQKIEVGGYKNAINEALAENELFNDALGNLNGAGKLAVDLFNKMAGTFNKVEDAEEGTARGAKKLGKALKAAGIAALIALIGSLGAAFSATREGTLKFDRAIGVFNASLGVLVGSLSNVGLGLIGLGTALGSVISGNFTQAANQWNTALTQLTTSFDGFGNRVKENIENNDELIISTYEHADAVRQLERDIAKLQSREELQQAISDDATLSFKAREEAIIKSIELSEERIEKEKELAESQVNRARKVLRIELKNSSVIKDLNDAQIDDLINNEELRGKVSEEALEKQQEAILGLIEIETQLTAIRKEQDLVVSQLKQDRLEKDLDILIDGFDNVKTINEQIVADDRFTLEERSKVLAETNRLANISFQSQKDTLQEFSETTIDFNDLINTSDAEALNQKIRGLGLSEIIEGRLLEVIRERRIVTQDLTVVENELTDAFRERARAQEDITQAIDNELKAGELAAAQREERLEDEFILRKQILEDNAFFEINLVAETADERRLIQEKLINDLAALEFERVKNVESANKKIEEDDERLKQERIDKAIAFGNKIADSLSEQIKDKNNEANEAANSEISRLEESVTEQTRIAKEGGNNILAEEKAQLAKRRLERQRELERQAKQERLIALSQAFVNSFAEFAKEDPDTAFAKAAFQTFAAEGFARLIAGFAEGGYTGDGGKYDVAGTVHKGEFVVDKATTAAIGLKGATMDDFKQRFSGGNLLMSPHAFKTMEAGNIVSPNEVMIGKLSNDIEKQTELLTRAIKSNAVKQQLGVDELGNFFSRQSVGNSTTKKTYKNDRETL